MSKRLFVGNVNPQVTEGQLRDLFSAAGEVVRVSIPLDRATAQPRGFAFVEFAEEEQAERALDLFDEALLEGRRIRPRVAFEERQREAPRQRRYRPREAAPDLGDGEPEATFGWSSFDDYSAGRARGKPRRRGKHGVDRKRAQGTRRFID